ncbi:hypothetical protein OJF2_74170 [Aquisphaera giovannonii]|uniref:Uncharacterized protein n=1 Tax=Aquisphaera giovannonii TaxID=406548 RepID=A0A5B9WE40_9BACT|nr:hypothetical protein [Aquisphaera giovannonii]QEH38807.1 hypothetical protein OJF2_74170 [Aquisphaera giovannonii]
MDIPRPGLPPAESVDGAPPAPLGTSPGQARILAMALAAGLIAGVAAWLAGEAILRAYGDTLSPKIRREVSPEAVRRYGQALLASAAATYASLGAILGGCLGLAGGLARRAAAAGARAALVGCAAGAAAGGLVSLGVLPGFLRDRDPQAQDLVQPLLTVGSICAAAGAAGGLAFALGLGRRGRWFHSLAGGLLGAGLGAAAYEVIGAVAFSTGKTDRAISMTPETRAMLHVLVAALAAAGSALILGMSPRRPAEAPPEA